MYEFTHEFEKIEKKLKLYILLFIIISLVTYNYRYHSPIIISNSYRILEIGLTLRSLQIPGSALLYFINLEV